MTTVFKRLKIGTQQPESFKGTLEVFKNGKYTLQHYRDEKARSTTAKLQEDKKELKEAEIRERKMFEE